MTEVSELLVKLRPEGAEEVQSSLDSTSDKFKKTAEIADEQSQKLDEFSDRWENAMGTIVTGLSVATAGLLSQIPIIGTVTQGLFAILEALALRINGVLRPVLRGVADTLFDWAAAILEAKGPLAELASIGLTVGFVLSSLVAVIGGVATALAQFGIGPGGVAAITTLLKGLASVIGTVIGILGGPLTLAILAIIGVVTGLYLAWQNNWFGIRDTVTDVVSTVAETLSKWWDGLVALFQRGFGKLLKKAFNFKGQLIALVKKIAAGFRIGFETMFSLVLNNAKNFANSLVSIIESGVNKALGAIPKEVRDRLGLPGSVNVGSAFQNTQSTGAILRSAGRQKRTRFREIEREEQRRRDRNPFADRQELKVTIRPKELEQFLSAEQDKGASFRGE